ncbi:MAG TPA: hypothetical protein VF352_04315 [Anaerolineales bacterium]
MPKTSYVTFISRLALPGTWEPDDLAAYVLAYQGIPDPGNDQSP